MYESLEFQKEKREKNRLILINNGQTFPKLDEQHEYVYKCNQFNEIQEERAQRDPHGRHCNQKQRQKENLKRGKRKTTCCKVSSIDFQMISPQKTCRPEDSEKELKGKKIN